VDRYNLWKGRPHKSLTEGISQTGGRNNSGRISVWHKGGGAKRLYRQIDFHGAGECDGVVQRIEYDPNRSARIALVKDALVGARHSCSPPRCAPLSEAHAEQPRRSHSTRARCSPTS